jgi:hypothetical protein
MNRWWPHVLRLAAVARLYAVKIQRTLIVPEAKCFCSNKVQWRCPWSATVLQMLAHRDRGLAPGWRHRRPDRLHADRHDAGALSARHAGLHRPEGPTGGPASSPTASFTIWSAKNEHLQTK